MSVSEGAGTIEVCVVISEPDKDVLIPDVVVYVRTWFFGEASELTMSLFALVLGINAEEEDDYKSISRLSLPLSHTDRRACFPVTIIDDTIFEHDEDFSIFMERDTEANLGIPLTIEPSQSTLKILDDDG